MDNEYDPDDGLYEQRIRDRGRKNLIWIGISVIAVTVVSVPLYVSMKRSNKVNTPTTTTSSSSSALSNVDGLEDFPAVSTATVDFGPTPSTGAGSPSSYTTAQVHNDEDVSPSGGSRPTSGRAPNAQPTANYPSNNYSGESHRASSSSSSSSSARSYSSYGHDHQVQPSAQLSHGSNNYYAGDQQQQHRHYSSSRSSSSKAGKMGSGSSSSSEAGKMGSGSSSSSSSSFAGHAHGPLQPSSHYYHSSPSSSSSERGKMGSSGKMGESSSSSYSGGSHRHYSGERPTSTYLSSMIPVRFT